ncbi:transposase [Mesorhizobium waimense]|uniref:Transposase n=1 Tax=Mesorhizobium waimense TaxID=1300307 RepID=A0A3A5JRD6_9HYPH|nr:transposase [Mesorhizobium waimense]RJT21512.1 transposase [Mesorhizobium waimense]
MAESYDPDRLNDAQWARLAHLMPGGCKGKRGPRTNSRLFRDAIFWMARSEARWRDLPERFGDHRIVKRRYFDRVGRGLA